MYTLDNAVSDLFDAEADRYMLFSHGFPAPLRKYVAEGRVVLGTCLGAVKELLHANGIFGAVIEYPVSIGYVNILGNMELFNSQIGGNQNCWCYSGYAEFAEAARWRMHPFVSDLICATTCFLPEAA